jgi:chitinase
MADEAELALTALHQQILSAYGAAGPPLSDADGWKLVGATPMIGQNDIADEVFGLDDARQLVSFAQLHQVGRLSMWSANRDQWCGPNYPNVSIVSDSCSGVEQSPGDFAAILAGFGPGQPLSAASESGDPASASVAADTATAATGAATTGAVDDPATSPYAIWNVNEAYAKGVKTVWHRNVYEAKWYTTGDQPDAPVATVAQTPWTLIGPVLAGEHPAPTPTLPAGTYPDWTATDVYVAGSRVLLDGVGYQAKYWTQGDLPGAVPTAADASSPWQLLTG